MAKPTVAIVGASSNRNKFGNRAVRAYLRQGYEVFPVHPSESAIEGLTVHRNIADIPNKPLDRISIYVPPAIGLEIIEKLHPNDAREIWLNPGAESPSVLARAKTRGLPVVVGCSIVDIGASPYGLD